jgi:hypothetical protein
MTEELLRLRAKVESLEAELEKARTRAPEGTAELAQGADTVSLRFTFDGEFQGSCRFG